MQNRTKSAIKTKFDLNKKKRITPDHHQVAIDVHRAGIGEYRLVQGQNDEIDITRVDLTGGDMILNFKVNPKKFAE